MDKWNLAESLAFYKARFADADNFTFVFVGSFTPETHQAAGRDLPREPARDARAGDLARPRHPAADGVVEKTIEKGIAPKSQVSPACIAGRLAE